MLRELKGWTQVELAKHSGISASNLSLLENGRVEIGKRRVEQLAKAFDVHPAIIMFPEYEAKEIQKAA
ncbi:MAG: transcriptional regulator [Deltaproteobacteria bacterium CG_4_10_14_3_um_filter_60_8]|nr:MAG: transcriptional regulator [Deltaproteobacteria bacterium CG_4_10_14_3_um_filter_60_8]